MSRPILSAISLLLFAQPVLAHDGHGAPAHASSWLHYVLEPDHLPVLLLTVGILWFAGRWTLRRLERSAATRRR